MGEFRIDLDDEVHLEFKVISIREKEDMKDIAAKLIEKYVEAKKYDEQKKA